MHTGLGCFPLYSVIEKNILDEYPRCYNYSSRVVGGQWDFPSQSRIHFWATDQKSSTSQILFHYVSPVTLGGRFCYLHYANRKLDFKDIPKLAQVQAT